MHASGSTATARTGRDRRPRPRNVDILRRRARRISDVTPADRGRNIAVRPWGAIRSGSRRRVSVVSVVMQIEGCEGRVRTFEFVVRFAPLCSLMLDVACVVVPTVTVAADAESSNGDGLEDGRPESAQAQFVVGDVNAEGGVSVPWAAWGPRATALSDQTQVGWRYLVGERRATIEHGVHRIRIRDYNPYRIRQTKASMVAKGLGRHEWGDSHEHEGEDWSDEGEGIVDPFHPQGTRRITEK